jgi:hypothetical protein
MMLHYDKNKMNSTIYITIGCLYLISPSLYAQSGGGQATDMTQGLVLLEGVFTPLHQLNNPDGPTLLPLSLN